MIRRLQFSVSALAVAVQVKYLARTTSRYNLNDVEYRCWRVVLVALPVAVLAPVAESAANVTGAGRTRRLQRSNVRVVHAREVAQLELRPRSSQSDSESDVQG